MKHPLNRSATPAAFVVAFALFGAPSSPVADWALPSAGDAFANMYACVSIVSADDVTRQCTPIDNACPSLAQCWVCDGDFYSACNMIIDNMTSGGSGDSDGDGGAGGSGSEGSGGGSGSGSNNDNGGHCGRIGNGDWGSRDSSCACDSGQERESGFLTGGRLYWCRDLPPDCGSGHADSNCECDGVYVVQRLGNDGLYYCHNTRANGASCTVIVLGQDDFYGAPPYFRPGTYIGGLCVQNPPTCAEIEVAIKSLGVATSLAGIPTAQLGVRIALAGVGVTLALGDLIEAAGC